MKRVYADNNATTKVDDRVVEEMLPLFNETYGNPSSMHTFGAEAEKKQKAGPVQCAGCHDPKLYPKPTPAPVIEPPKYEKKDTMLIVRADSIMPGVPFLHKIHQEKNNA